MDIEKIIQAHRQAVKEGHTLRLIDKRQVSRIEENGVSYIVKAYRLGIFHRLLHINVKCFRQLARLDGLTPATVYNGIEGHWQYVITEDAGKGDLFHLKENSYTDEQCLQYFASAGELLGQLHERNMYHGDTKTPNFVVNTKCTGLPQVLIVDCDRLRYYRNGVPLMRQAFNLAQFICSIRDCQARTVDFLEAFLRAYMVVRAEDIANWKSVKALAFDIAVHSKHIERWTEPEILDAVRERI